MLSFFAIEVLDRTTYCISFSSCSNILGKALVSLSTFANYAPSFLSTLGSPGVTGFGGGVNTGLGTFLKSSAFYFS